MYTYGFRYDLWRTLEPYQRHNHIPGFLQWNKKDSFNRRMMKYQESSGKQIWSIPKTYPLSNSLSRKKFRKVLFEKEGLSRPWVLKVPNMDRGLGITML